jgi:hypothetical protein
MRSTNKTPTGSSTAGRSRSVESATDRTDLAWLVALPAAAFTVAAMLLVGAPLGRTIFPVRTLEFWPSTLPYVHPKPAEQARYLIALGGALLVPIAVFASGRWRLPRLPFARLGALAMQLAFVAALACGILTRETEGTMLGGVKFGLGYFTGPTIAVALLIGLAFTVCLSSPQARSRIRDLLFCESRLVRWGAVAVAALATLIWLLPAIQLDGTVADASVARVNLAFTFDEGLAVLNGHSPLVDYVAQYGSLWPYPVAIPLHFTNGSLGSYTASMAAITGVSMLAVYGLLQRVTRSAVAALALFLPFLATSFFIVEGNPITRFSFADYFGVFPMRYAGPYLVAFLIARHLSGARPRLAIWIFLGAGLTLLNNADFGVPALGAAVVALVAAAPGPRTRRWSLELLFEAIAGLVAAYVLVSILTLARAGELPDLALLFRYAHLFALAGYLMLPTPWFGFWVVIYLTFAAALAVAAIMIVRRSAERTTIGMLAWIGIFGLGIGSYYDGRSHPQVLVAMFSAWSLAVVLLVVVAVRSAAGSGRRVGPAQVALLVGFGLAVCSLAQFPTPWGSIQRLRSPAATELFQPRAEARFVAAHTRPGEPVAMLPSLGQRISREADVDDTTPYTGSASMPTKQQFREMLSRLREAGGSTVIVSEPEALPEMIPALEREEFRISAREGSSGTTEVPTLGGLVVMTRRQDPR